MRRMPFFYTVGLRFRKFPKIQDPLKLWVVFPHVFSKRIGQANGRCFVLGWERIRRDAHGLNAFWEYNFRSPPVENMWGDSFLFYVTVFWWKFCLGRRNIFWTRKIYAHVIIENASTFRYRRNMESFFYIRFFVSALDYCREN